MKSRPAITSARADSQTQKAHHPDFAGLGFALMSVIISALQPVVMRYGAVNIDPILYCSASVIVAAVCVVSMLALKGELRILADRRYLPNLFALSMAGTVATSLTLIYGLQKIDAVAAVILLNSEPLYSLVLSRIFLGERHSFRQVLATAVILTGIGTVFGGGHAFNPLYAAALVFITPLFWQSSHVVSLGVMPPLSPSIIVAARYFYAALVLAILMFTAGRDAIPQLRQPSVSAIIVFSGVVLYFLGSYSWYGAISRLSLAWATAFIIPGVPVLSFLFAMLFLGERPSAVEIIGITVAVAGIVMLVMGGGANRDLRDRTAWR
jgi:drug/metabolite transporter (DMT)-like permease